MELNYTIKFDSHIEGAKKLLDKDKEKILYAWGVETVTSAVQAISAGENKAVDTGRLRASISFVTANGQTGESGQSSPNSQSGDTLSGSAEKDCVIVGTNVEYAEYVHNGTSKMAARPFLRQGIDDAKTKMKEDAEAILKGEM